MEAEAGTFAKYFIKGNLQDPCPNDGGEWTLNEALKNYESFHILEAQQVKWSPEHLFKCNCTERDCFKSQDSVMCPHSACRNGVTGL